MEAVNQHLRRARRRLRAALAVRWGCTGTAIGLALAAVLIGVAGRWVPRFWEANAWATGALFAVAGAIAGATATLSVRLTDFRVARTVEAHLDLKDRLSTAVWAQERQVPGHEEVAADAAGVLDESSIRDSIKIARPVHAAMPALCLVVLVCVILLPGSGILQSPRDREARLRIQRHGVELQRVAANLRTKPVADQRLQQELANELERLGRQLQSGRVGEEQAQIKMHRMDAKMRQVAEELAARSGVSNTWKVPENLAATSHAMAAESATKRAADLPAGKQHAAQSRPVPGRDITGRSSAPSVELPPDLAKRLAELLALRDFIEAQKLLEGLRAKLGDGLTARQQQALSGDLEALAKALAQADIEELAKQLLEAAKALNAMDPEQARKMLQQACAQCNRLGLGFGQSAALAAAAAKCRFPSGGFNQYSSTDHEQRGSLGPGNSPKAPRQPAGGRLDGDWARIYAPWTTASDSTPVKARSQIGTSGKVQQTEVEGMPDAVQEPTVPYYQVLPRYREAAEKAMSREDIPLSQRKRVRDYFEALQ